MYEVDYFLGKTFQGGIKIMLKNKLTKNQQQKNPMPKHKSPFSLCCMNGMYETMAQLQQKQNMYLINLHQILLHILSSSQVFFAL